MMMSELKLEAKITQTKVEFQHYQYVRVCV